MAQDYLVFIHGMGEGDPPPEESYQILWQNIETEFEKTIKGQFKDEFQRIDINWHTEELFKAENTIYTQAFPKLVNQKLSLLRPLRKFATFYIGDVIAYVSEDVNFIRRTVWEQMWQQLKQPLTETDATYSIVAHSLGSAIAFDYLYSLFKKDELFVPPPTPKLTAEEKTLLKERFRHFFTFGSPIGLFMMQKGSLWNHNQLFKEIYNPVRGQGRVWRNFYDKDDLVAYPLANLFHLNPDNHGCLLRDIEINTGTVFDAHTDYWQHRRLAREIAKLIPKD